MADQPTIAGKEPVEVKITAGKPVFWCSCGRSDNQPFCNGAHKDSGMEPLPLKLDEDKKVWLCQCKQTKNPPFCDGSHNQL